MPQDKLIPLTYSQLELLMLLADYAAVNGYFETVDPDEEEELNARAEELKEIEELWERSKSHDISLSPQSDY